MTPEQLKNYLATTDSDPLLLDVRQPWEFDICKIEGSELVPMGQVQASIDALDSDRETVVICHHGIRSRQIAMMLERAGFENIINLKGGLDQWARTVDPDMATY